LDLVNLLNSAHRASMDFEERQGRRLDLRLAVVTNNADPENRRRVRVLVSDKAPDLVESPWLTRVEPSPYLDSVIPGVGQTVLVGFNGGVPEDGFYVGVGINDPNPPSQDGPQSHTLVVPNLVRISAGSSIRLETDSGSYVELRESGAIELRAANGHRWVIGGPKGTPDGTRLPDGGSVAFEGLTEFSLNSKQVATLGAVDNRGDHLVSRGW
jgi:hypothetical protein